MSRLDVFVDAIRLHSDYREGDDTPRLCVACNGRLSRYNPEEYCAPCRKSVEYAEDRMSDDEIESVRAAR